MLITQRRILSKHPAVISPQLLCPLGSTIISSACQCSPYLSPDPLLPYIGSSSLLNVGNSVPDYMMLHVRRQQSCMFILSWGWSQHNLILLSTSMRISHLAELHNCYAAPQVCGCFIAEVYLDLFQGQSFSRHVLSVIPKLPAKFLKCLWGYIMHWVVSLQK
jgi:hypothetical protein